MARSIATCPSHSQSRCSDLATNDEEEEDVEELIARGAHRQADAGPSGAAARGEYPQSPG